MGVKVYQRLPFDYELKRQQIKQALMDFKRETIANHDKLRQKDDPESHRIADELAELLHRTNALLRRL